MCVLFLNTYIITSEKNTGKQRVNSTEHCPFLTMMHYKRKHVTPLLVHTLSKNNIATPKYSNTKAY